MMKKTALLLLCFMLSLKAGAQADSAALGYMGAFNVVENEAGDTVYTCDFVVMQVYVNDPGSYTWSWTPAFGLASTTTYMVISKPVDTVTYQVHGYGPYDTVSLQVTVIEQGLFTLNALPVLADQCHAGIGQATVFVSGPAAYTYTYNWSNGDTGYTADSLVAGKYTIAITNQYGCAVVDSVQINNNMSSFTLDGTVSAASCGSCADGAIDVGATVSPASVLQYNWSNGASTQDIGGLLPGTYTLTVTDAYGCTASDSFNITALAVNDVQPPQPVCTVYPVPASENVYVSARQPIDEVFLFSNDGRLMFTLHGHGSHTLLLPLGGLPAGLYYLRTGHRSVRIVKN